MENTYSIVNISISYWR